MRATRSRPAPSTLRRASPPAATRTPYAGPRRRRRACTGGARAPVPACGCGCRRAPRAPRGGNSRSTGRRPDQDIVIEDPSVSRAHARIEISGGRPSVVDLGSTNGTLVNGRRAGAEPLPLRPGDRLQVGAVLLELLAEP